MAQAVVKVENMGKLYKLGSIWATTLREAVQHFGRKLSGGKIVRDHQPFHNMHASQEVPEPGTFWALRDLNFPINAGEIVGIIGRNGAGKSTLLKILSRITEPSRGRVVLRGRVASLLEVGTGFHPEMTGRENVFLNGAILGMTRKEVRRKFDEIVAFAEVEPFIDTPVKRYSSGMNVRLAFAVAAHLQQAILIVDEVLAVGDAKFQKKCLGKMHEVGRSGRTILFVSHNMGAVRNLCRRGIVLRKARIMFDGPVDSAVHEYLSYLKAGSKSAFTKNPERSGTGGITLTGARLVNAAGDPQEKKVAAGTTVIVEFDYQNSRSIATVQLGLTIYNQMGVAVTNLDTFHTNTEITKLGRSGKFRCTIPDLPLPLGEYHLAASIMSGPEIIDHVPNALVFEVNDSAFFETSRVPEAQYSACLMHHQWEHQAVTAETGDSRLPADPPNE